MTNDKQPRSLYAIANEIYELWCPVHYSAVPYLEAMQTLQTIDDHYMNDDGRSIVNYFLGNARSWRGPAAKRIKAELKVLLNQPKK